MAAYNFLYAAITIFYKSCFIDKMDLKRALNRNILNEL